MNLTKKEKQLLPVICLSYDEIAKRLCIEKTTVRSHIHNLLIKFPDCGNRFCLILKALKQGVITLEEIETK